MFANRRLLIATMHKKEQVIAPILERELGVSCFTLDHFDTDSLGTFSGEIERKSDPISTAIEKCKTAMTLANCDLGVASEGSFGNHLTVFFATADDEFLVFIDLKNNLEIIARNISLDTNFASETISSIPDLKTFAKKVQFPSHGIILKDNALKPKVIYKDCNSWSDLETAFYNLTQQQTSITAETDMRAMRNPTRMKVIEQATLNLIKKIKSTCPSCNHPGFEVIEILRGLPCEICNAPTRSPKIERFKCKKCTFEALIEISIDKKYEDPMYCDFCNP